MSSDPQNVLPTDLESCYMGKHDNLALHAEKWMVRAIHVRLIPVIMIWGLFFFSPKNGQLLGGANLPSVVALTAYIAIGIVVMAGMFRSTESLSRQVYFLFSYLIILSGGFSWLYWIYGYRPYFNMRLTHLDAFYVMAGTFSTAGTGNIVATGEAARAIQTIQMLLDSGFVLFTITLVVARFIATSSGANPPPSS